MRIRPSVLAALAAGSLVLTSCSAVATDEPTAAATEEAAASADAAASAVDSTAAIDVASLVEATYADLEIEEADLTADASAAVDVVLADGASSGGDGVSIDGDVVTITAGGVYRLSGELTAGRVVVDADGEDVTLLLDGVDITSPSTAGIEVVAADQVVLSLAGGSTNAVSDAQGATEPTEDDAPNAAIYSTADLFVTGTGTLVVAAAANDGITSKDTLVIDSGTVQVTAADDALRGKDRVVIRGGDVTLEAGGDGLTADNVADDDEPAKAVGVIWIDGGTLDITAAADAIDAVTQVTIDGGALAIDAGDDAVHADGILRIASGTVDVEASAEGLEGAIVLLSGGQGTVVSSDDGINASDGSGADSGMGGAGAPGGGASGGGARPGAGEESGATTTADGSADEAAAAVVPASLTTDAPTTASEDASGTDGVRLEISGGTWAVDAEGDGLDVNGAVTMTGGTVVIAGPTESMNGALDFDGDFTIDGGTLVATGAAGMAMAPSGGAQAIIGVSYGETVAAGETVTVVDEDGSVLASYTSAKESQTLVLSTPGLVAGTSYDVVLGGTAAGEAIAGLVLDSSLSGGDVAGTVEAS